MPDAQRSEDRANGPGDYSPRLSETMPWDYGSINHRLKVARELFQLLNHSERILFQRTKKLF